MLELDFENGLSAYKDSKTFPDMVDFISGLIMVDPICRLSSEQALEHPWLKAELNASKSQEESKVTDCVQVES